MWRNRSRMDAKVGTHLGEASVPEGDCKLISFKGPVRTAQ